MTVFQYNNTRISLSSKLLFVALILLLPQFISAQQKKKVEIVRAGSLKSSERIANAQRLIDSVVIKHEDILMYCDSAYLYENENRVDAFGHVHINQGDTLNLYARKVFYDGNRSFAQAIHNVRLLNKEVTLYTDTLDYDMEQNIGYYDCSGKIVDSTNTLTSKIGRYYMNDNVAHFTDSVVGFSEKYTLESENIKYNTESEIIYFEGPTTIQDSVNTLYAEDGWYNTMTGEADLKLSPKVYNETQFLKAKQIIYNKDDGDGFAYGDVHLEDFENRTIVQGNYVAYNEISELATVTDSAVFISYNETDSLFLHADTLRTMPDTIEGENIVKGYYGVRFYRKDIQGVCDSMTYYTKDSTVQLINNPVLWSQNQQITADRIELIQHFDAPDEIHMFKNSFIISEQDSGMYDQIKGKNMIGYVVNGKLNKMDVDGNGQTLYYAREEEEIIGMNRAESSNISIRFKDGEIYQIAFQKQPEGELKPILELTENDKFLSDFKWLIKLRPTSKSDIFRKPKPAAPEKTEEVAKE